VSFEMYWSYMYLSFETYIFVLVYDQCPGVSYHMNCPDFFGLDFLVCILSNLGCLSMLNLKIQHLPFMHFLLQLFGVVPMISVHWDVLILHLLIFCIFETYMFIRISIWSISMSILSYELSCWFLLPSFFLGGGVLFLIWISLTLCYALAIFSNVLTSMLSECS